MDFTTLDNFERGFEIIVPSIENMFAVGYQDRKACRTTNALFIKATIAQSYTFNVQKVGGAILYMIYLRYNLYLRSYARLNRLFLNVDRNGGPARFLW